MRKKKSERKADKGCCGTDVKPFETPLSKCLMFDPFPPSGACHDTDPFGVYHTQSDGSVFFQQALRCTPGYVKCASPLELDALLVKVFLTATKHSRRHLVMVPDYVRSFTVRNACRLFSNPPSEGREAYDALFGPDSSPSVSEAIPKNVILCVDGLPEEVGRLGYSCGSYGVSLMDPWRVGSVEVLASPSFPVRGQRLA